MKSKCYLLFLLLSVNIYGQESDTVALDFAEILVLDDTIYYGIQDSLIVLPIDTEYRITKNLALRNKKYYQKKPEKKQLAISLHKEYIRYMESQMIRPDDHSPDKFNASEAFFELAEGKIIKSIHYKQVGIGSGNVNDTSRTSAIQQSAFIEKTHKTTRKWVIRENIRFKKNQAINSRVLSDNERILRNLPYIEDARIHIIPIENSVDSVNILVVTKDNFPIGMGGEIRDYDHFIVEPYNRNFNGLGHNLGATFVFKGNEDQQLSYGMNYNVNNFFSSFIGASFEYMNKYDANYIRVKVYKPFYTTDTKLGGELAYENMASDLSTTFYTPDSVFSTRNFYTYDKNDAWLGYSMFLTDDFNKPFVTVSGRYTNTNYSTRPIIERDTNYAFHNNELILGSLTLKKLSFLKTTKLFGYGIVEDVPVGFNLKITGGWSQSTFYNRPYGGIDLYYAKLFKKAGVLNINMEYGGYQRNGVIEDGVVGMELTFFSTLSKALNVDLRHLASITYNSVINPLYLTPINFGDNIRGLKQSGLYGKSTTVLRYQPIFYTNYKLIGFKLSVNPFVDMGWISKSEYFKGKKQFFTVYGITASIKNESLTFPALNVHVGYYPNWVDKDFKFSVKFTFKDLNILEDPPSPKPETSTPRNIY